MSGSVRLTREYTSFMHDLCIKFGGNSTTPVSFRKASGARVPADEKRGMRYPTLPISYPIVSQDVKTCAPIRPHKPRYSSV